MARKKNFPKDGDIVIHLDGELRFIGKLNVISEETGEAIIAPALVWKGNEYYKDCENCRISRYACSRADAVWLLRYYRYQYENIKTDLEKSKMKIVAINYSNTEMSKGYDDIRRELDDRKKSTIIRIIKKQKFPYFGFEK